MCCAIGASIAAAAATAAVLCERCEIFGGSPRRANSCSHRIVRVLHRGQRFLARPNDLAQLCYIIHIIPHHTPYLCIKLRHEFIVAKRNMVRCHGMATHHAICSWNTSVIYTARSVSTMTTTMLHFQKQLPLLKLMVYMHISLPLCLY